MIEMTAEQIEDLAAIVREGLGRDPAPHEIGEEAGRMLRTMRAATANMDRAREKYTAAARALGDPAEIEKARRAIADRMGVHYHGSILRRSGTLDQAYAGDLVRVPDETIRRSAFSPWSGTVGTPSFGGVPGVERNADMRPYLARGFSFDAGEFSAMYRSDSIIREAVADIVGVIAGATIEVKSHPQLTARSAELLGIDRDQHDRIADALNAELHLGGWGDFGSLVQEILRVAMVNGACVHEFMLEPFAPLGQRLLGIQPRMPNTWVRWIQDPDTGEAVALEQTDPNGFRPGAMLDLSRCIHVAIDRDGDNFEGLSLIRSARAWDVLSFEVCSSLILHWQRFGAGVPVIRRSNMGQASAGGDRETYEAFAKYANLASAVLEVGAGIDVDLLQMQTSGTGFSEIMEIATRMKRAAMRNSLAGLGVDGKGAYNLGDVKSQLWMKGLRVFASQIERGFNRLIRTYVDTYFGPQAVYPVLAISGFAARSAEETIKVHGEFAKIVAEGVYTPAELVEIAEKAEIAWNGRGEEADTADETAGATAAPTEPTEPPPVADPAPEQRTEEPDGAVPPSGAAKAAAAGRRARAKAVNKWAGTIAEVSLSRAIAEQRPLSRLQLREIEAYFAEAAPGAPYTDGSPEWQEWQCMGGDAMAQWVANELLDDGDADRRAPEKYSHIEFTPPEGVQAAAARALEVRAKKPASQRGMTPVGIARARDLANGRAVSPETARRMLAFFERHEGNKSGETWDEQGKGWQAWHGWGGDAGFAWARKLVRQMDAADADRRVITLQPDPEVYCGCGSCGSDAERRAKRATTEVYGRGGGSFATWRSLTGPEQSVAWDEIAAQKDRARERLERALARAQREHREAFVAAAGELTDPVAAASLAVDWTAQYRAAVTPVVRQYGRFVASDMLEEIEDATGGRWRADRQEVAGTADARAEASVALLSRVVNDRTNETLRGAAVQVASGSPRATLTGADPGVGFVAGALIVQSLSATTNAIRATVAGERGPRIARAVYSAVMDRYTCPACEAADGTVVEYGSAEYDRLSPPNPRCRSVENSKGGENMCQCVWVYEYADDAEPRRATSEPTPVRLYVGLPGSGKTTAAEASGLPVADRDAWVIDGAAYRAEGVDESYAALGELIAAGPCAYVACGLTADSRAKIVHRVRELGGEVTEIVECSAPAEWLTLVDEDRGGRIGAALPHMVAAWEPVLDDEAPVVQRVTV